MFGREFMIRTNNRTLKETPDVLNSIGVDITTHPFLSTMVDCLVSSVVVSNTIISRPIIGIDSLSVRCGMVEAMKRFAVSFTIKG